MIKLNKSIDKLIETSNNQMFVFGFLDYNWKQIVGKEVSKKTELVKIENKTLFIKCSSPVWKAELQYQKQQIIEKIKKKTDKITNIIII
tara:strand:+ start:204 stop:470 length:267 start_codon:yes stop_codon:yes gene_type:complete